MSSAPLTPDELTRLEECNSREAWDEAVSAIKMAHDGYPCDWYASVLGSGLAARVLGRFGESAVPRIMVVPGVMTDDKPKNRMRPIHPGEVLREEFAPAALAAKMLMPIEDLQPVLDEKQAVTEPMAARLASALGTTAEYWLNLQKSYNETVAQQEYRVDPARMGRTTGIPIRSKGLNGHWAAHDVAELDRESLTRWVNSRPRDSDWMQNIILALLSHERE